MKRRILTYRSLTRNIMFLGILALACYGGYVLYQDNKDVVNDHASQVEQKAKAIKRVLEK